MAALTPTTVYNQELTLSNQMRASNYVEYLLTFASNSDTFTFPRGSVVQWAIRPDTTDTQTASYTASTTTWSLASVTGAGKTMTLCVWFK